MIAQDLDELLKKYNYIGDMVHEDNHNFGVDYIDFISILILWNQKQEERITKLEALLLRSSEEKDEMRQTILLLTEQVAKLTVKVDYLEEDKPQLGRTTRKRRIDENI